MLKRNLVLACILCFTASLYISCKSEGKKSGKSPYDSPPGYDLSAGTQLKLPPELDEISGIFYYPSDTAIFCINDEKGFLYKIYLDRLKEMEKWRFTKHGDFEDLLLLDSNFYVLQSSGNLLRIKFFSGDSLQMDTIQLPLKGTNDFEILYYEKEKSRMVLLCKECEQDQNNQVSAIAFDPATNITSTAYVLQEKSIEQKLKNKGRFKASAAAISPVTNELFVISSVNKALLVCDVEGNVKEVYRLDPKIFKQPEGMSFTPIGDLIISNESADRGAANILFFKYKQTN